MKQTVGTTAVKLPVSASQTPVIQNLGPGIVYLDGAGTVAAGTGLKLPVGAVYEVPRDLSSGSGELWLVADAASTDVRFLVVG
jgi:hypothetical protein